MPRLVSTLDQRAFGGLELDVDRVRAALAATGHVYLRRVPDGFDHVAQLTRLGPAVPQFDGVVVRDIRPDPAVDNSVYLPSNTRELRAHTEWFEFPGPPPRYQALWCVTQAEGPGGETTLADSYDFVAGLPPEQLARLRARSYTWTPTAALARSGVSYRCRHPLVEDRHGALVVRFPCDDRCRDHDALMAGYLAAGRRYFAEHRLAVRIEERGVLVWDNWRMMHARNAFTDRRRHLRRLLMADRR
ncbi:TauD/TfdA family dioxygenase [Actinacidiphila sp. bgisy144]|uniref:TauD/TfdA family dioxygenase n=1 Tax=unclassified Actinacidiphila TaxID=2995708 RepID=UPI003EBB8F24